MTPALLEGIEAVFFDLFDTLVHIDVERLPFHEFVMKGEDGIVVKESPLLPEHMRLTKPGTFYSVGAGGALGWGLGTALGLKAAAPDPLVICTVGDGSYMFGNPVSAPSFSCP